MAIPSGPQLQPPQSASTQAIAALILGILGFTCCHICAPVAWYLGYAERKSIRAGLSPAAGEAFAVAGMILGIIGSCLLIFVVLWVFFWGGMAVLGGLLSHPR